MPKPASTTARGYGWQHQKTRQQWAPLVAAGAVTCWRCGRPIAPGQAWDLGHDDNDRTVYRGPEHRGPCNRAAGARKGNRLRGRRRAAAKGTISQPPTAARWFTSKRQTKVCPICGATFTTIYDSRTCGRTCGIELRRRNAPPKPVKPVAQRQCTECGVAFEVRSRAVTCGETCSRQRNRRVSLQRYYDDPEYRAATIERAKARYRESRQSPPALGW